MHYDRCHGAAFLEYQLNAAYYPANPHPEAVQRYHHPVACKRMVFLEFDEADNACKVN
jgi:hypothetical protein